MASDRVHKSILNAEVNLIFYFLSLILSFYSRKVFLNNLGADFIGLSGTLGNILGYLNLAELGIGSCISYFLYKPLQSGNHKEIQEIMAVFGYLYRCIGVIILIGGMFVSLSFPWIFGNTSFSLSIIYFTFFSFLCSSLIGYFINYRQILLIADQKNYVVAIYFQTSNIIKTALQIIFALIYQNLYLWVSVELLFNIIGCIILNWKINTEYPWLKKNIYKKQKSYSKYPEIKRKTKQIFIHKIKDFIMRQSDELFIFAFASLKMVAFYGNYIMIISKITLLFNSILDSVSAGIGNLVAEGDKKKILGVFWELMTIRHFISGLLCYSIFLFIEPFISLWLGNEYILNHNILILLVIYIYIANSRGVVDMFNHAHGLYADVWSAWVELTINVTITIICGLSWGIAGILIGKISSLFFIVIFWKPYYLFKSGFKIPVRIYWKGTLRYYIISAIAFIGGIQLTHLIQISPYKGYFQWVLFCIISLSFWLFIEISLLGIFTKESRQCIHRIKSILK